MSNSDHSGAAPRLDVEACVRLALHYAEVEEWTVQAYRTALDDEVPKNWCANERAEIEERVSELESRAATLRTLAAQLPELARDAERWRALSELVKENHMHKGLGGGVILCAAPANEFDKPWASIQAIDHENPRNTLWMVEAESLDAAIDAARSLPTEPTEESTR